MALYIRHQREPLARAKGRPDVVRGPAYWRFRASLEKYCRGRSLGRSFVISGNRGIGKTTMVYAAIEDLRRHSELERGEPYEKGEEAVERQLDAPLRRPMLVSLSAPDILRERERPQPTASGQQATTDKAAEPVPAAVEDSDNLLRQLARALHGAVARELSERFIDTLPPNAPLEHHEAGAQLQLELDAGAKVSALRRFWDLTNRLFQGVLFPPRDPFVNKPNQGRVKQGLAELIALDASVDAYRIAIGKVDEDWQSQSNKDEATDRPASWSDEVKNVAAPFAGLLGGAATGFGTFHTLEGSALVTKVLGSIGAALLSALVLTFSIKPKRTTTAESKVKFSRDNSVGSLAWRLSRVVDLLFEAGLAPVFVIDELDKAALGKDVTRWIEDRAQELKTLLTGQAFFCFLTGRGFAEKMHRDRTERKYPPSYTQFSNYLFVNYLPQDLHRYLNGLIRCGKSDDPIVAEHDIRQAALLPYVVLFRAEMHPIDMQRELSALVKEGDEVQLYASGQVVPRTDSFAVLFQLAIEEVLSDPTIERRMRDDPRFATLAIDAAYYVPRTWRAAASKFVLSDHVLDAYFMERRKPDVRRVDVDAPAEPEEPLPDLPEVDKVLLRKCVRDVLALIQEPARLRRLLASQRFAARYHGALDRADSASRLSKLMTSIPQTEGLLDAVTTDTVAEFCWKYDAHGVAVAGNKGPDELQAVTNLLQSIQLRSSYLLRTFGVTLEDLEARYALVQGSMTWSAAVTLAAQIAAAGANDPVLRGQITPLNEYAELLDRAWSRFGQALIVARLLEPSEPPQSSIADLRVRIHDALQALSTGLQLGAASNEQRAERIDDAFKAVVLRAAIAVEPDVDLLDLARQLWASAQPPIPPEVAIETFFDEWRESIRSRLQGSLSRTPSWADVAVVARHGEPLLYRAWERDTASTWCEILVSALASNASKASEVADSEQSASRARGAITQPAALVYPQWCVPYILTMLGFSQAGLDSAEKHSDRRFLESLPRRQSRQNVVIVMPASDPLDVSSWRVSSEYNAFVVPDDSLHEDCWRRWLATTGQSGWIIFEASASDRKLLPESLLPKNSGLAAIFPEERRAQMFTAEPLLSQRFFSGAWRRVFLETSPRYFVGAQGIDDAVSKAEALVHGTHQPVVRKAPAP